LPTAVLARIDGHVIALNRSYNGLPGTAKIEIGVRPEFVDVAAPSPGLLSARIERIDDLGRVRFARVRVGNAKFAARVPPGFSVPDDTAGLIFNPGHVQEHRQHQEPGLLVGDLFHHAVPSMRRESA
jgi:glycerol transport system ATP-binding protein